MFAICNMQHYILFQAHNGGALLLLGGCDRCDGIQPIQLVDDPYVYVTLGIFGLGKFSEPDSDQYIYEICNKYHPSRAPRAITK